MKTPLPSHGLKCRYILLSLLIGLFSNVLLGCGDGFVTPSAGEKQTAASLLNEGNETSPGPLKDYLVDINAYPYQNTSQTTPLEPENGSLVYYYKDLDLRFGALAGGLGVAYEAAKHSIWNNCSPELGNDSNSKYDCGELPVGEVLGPKRKKIFDVNLPATSGVADDVTYWVGSAQLPIYLRRKQVSDVREIKDLNTLTLNKFETGEGLLDASYFRIKPNGGTLELEFCFFSPGLKVSTEATNVHLSVKKEVAFLNFKSDAVVSIEAGSMSFDSANLCTLFYAKTDEDWKTSLDFQSVRAPLFNNLQFEGLEVSIDIQPKGILKIISKILDLVGKNIERELEETAKQQVNSLIKENTENILISEITSGEWFHKYLKQQMNEKVLPQMEEKMNASLKYLGPGSENYLQTKVRSACNKIASQLEGHVRLDFVELCHTSLRIKGHLFLKDAESEKLGCYSHFFQPENPLTVKDKWWSKQCKIRSKIEIITVKEFAPLFACIADVISHSGDYFDSAGSCQYELNLLLESTKNFAIPTTQLLETFEDRIQQDVDFDQWEQDIKEKYF